MFDKPVAFETVAAGQAKREWDLQFAPDWAVKFEVTGQPYGVWFTTRLLPPSYRGYITHVSFAALSADGIDQSLTGKMGKDAIKVLSSVGGSIREFVKKHPKTENLALAADKSEVSRVKLYRKVAPKLAKKLEWAGVAEVTDKGYTIPVIYREKPPSKIIKKKKKSAVAEALDENAPKSPRAGAEPLAEAQIPIAALRAL